MAGGKITEIDHGGVRHAAPKAQRVRSPESPFIPLGKALERAKEFLKAENRNAAPVSVAARHWRYAEKSSGALQTVAALKHFGLIADEGTGGARKVKLTELARRILLDEQQESPERDQAIRQAALQPKLYAELWKKWGVELPSDETFRTHLVLERNFNRMSADDFIRCYKETVEFAKLSESDSVPDDAGDLEAGEEGTRTENQPAVGGTPLRSPKPLVVPLARGEDERLRFNLSGGRAVRLIFAGPPPTQAEIDELMDYLKVSKRTFPTEQ